jgi:hypothetical protein
MQTQTLLRDLITSLRRQDNERLLEAMAREINNHIFIRGTFANGIGAGELTSRDMSVILARLQIVETTLGLSTHGQSPEAYAPKRQTSPIPLTRESRVSPEMLASLEADLQSSRAVRSV